MCDGFKYYVVRLKTHPLNLIDIIWSCDNGRSECRTSTSNKKVKRGGNCFLKVVLYYKNYLVLKASSIGKAMDLFWRCIIVIFSSTKYFEGTIFPILNKILWLYYSVELCYCYRRGGELKRLRSHIIQAFKVAIHNSSWLFEEPFLTMKVNTE